MTVEAGIRNVARSHLKGRNWLGEGGDPWVAALRKTPPPLYSQWSARGFLGVEKKYGKDRFRDSEAARWIQRCKKPSEDQTLRL